MTFSISKSELLLILNPIMRVVPKKAALPVLLSLKIEISGKGIKVTGSDGNNSLAIKGEIIESSEDKTFLVDAEPLHKIVKSIPDQPLSITVDGSVTIKHASGKLSIPEIDGVHSFPNKEIGEIRNEFTVKGDDLIKAVSKVLIFAEDDELRPAFSSICFNLDRKEVAGVNLNNVSTYPLGGVSGTGNILIPKAAAIILKGLILSESVKMMSDGNQVLFEDETTSLLCVSPIAGFANYKRIIESSNTEGKFTYKVDKSQLISAINRLEVVSERNITNKQSFVILNLGETQTLTTENTTFLTSGQENIQGEYHGESLDVKLESGSFCQHLSNIDEQEVEIVFSASNRPVLFRGGLVTSVTMPSS